jgi:hypothetical protein
VVELLPGVGSAESVYQLITGRSSVSDEEVNRLWAAVGVIPIAGGAVRKISEVNPDALKQLLSRPEGVSPGASIRAVDSLPGLSSNNDIHRGERHTLGILNPEDPLSTSLPRNGNRLVIDQGDLPTCGPVSCVMVLDTMGRKVDLAAIISQSDINHLGTTMPRLVKILNDNGVITQRMTNVTIEDLAKATATGAPAIVRMDLIRGGHAVVVDGITIRNGQRVVAVRDPADGRQYFTPVNEFLSSFSGEAAFTRR